MVAPGPRRVEAEHVAAVGVGESCGDVEEAVTQRFRFGAGEVTVEAHELGSGDEVRRDERHGQPCLVAGVVIEWDVRHSGCFPAADPVLDPGVAAVT